MHKTSIVMQHREEFPREPSPERIGRGVIRDISRAKYS